MRRWSKIDNLNRDDACQFWSIGTNRQMRGEGNGSPRAQDQLTHLSIQKISRRGGGENDIRCSQNSLIHQPTNLLSSQNSSTCQQNGAQNNPTCQQNGAQNYPTYQQNDAQNDPTYQQNGAQNYPTYQQNGARNNPRRIPRVSHLRSQPPQHSILNPYPLHDALRIDFDTSEFFKWIEHTDVNSLNEFGQTPLMIAATRGLANTSEVCVMTTILLEKGADITLKDHEGRNAIMLACQEVGDSAWSVLNAMLMNKRFEPAKLKKILEDVNNAGETAVMMAVLNDNPRCLKTLLKLGANCCGTWTVGDHAGENVYDLARKLGHREISMMLHRGRRFAEFGDDLEKYKDCRWVTFGPGAPAILHCKAVRKPTDGPPFMPPRYDPNFLMPMKYE